MGYHDHESTCIDWSEYEPKEYTFDEGAYDAYIESLEESTPIDLLKMHLKNIHKIREIKRIAEVRICKITQNDQDIVKILKKKLSEEEEEEEEEE